MTTGVVTGLAFEAACLRRAIGDAAVGIETTGGRSERVAPAVRRLLDGGATVLLSFGFAGGLDPNIRPGTIIVADRVILPDGRAIWTDAAWRDALELGIYDTLLRRAGHFAFGAIGGSVTPVTTPQQKCHLWKRSGAYAVDTESHAVAVAAEGGRVPFGIVRVVIDPASRTVPPAALVALRDDGGIDLAAILRSLLRHPGQLPGMIALARDAAAARRALHNAAALVSHALELPLPLREGMGEGAPPGRL